MFWPKQNWLGLCLIPFPRPFPVFFSFVQHCLATQGVVGCCDVSLCFLSFIFLRAEVCVNQEAASESRAIGLKSPPSLRKSSPTSVPCSGGKIASSPPLARTLYPATHATLSGHSLCLLSEHGPSGTRAHGGILWCIFTLFPCVVLWVLRLLLNALFASVFSLSLDDLSSQIL